MMTFSSKLVTFSSRFAILNRRIRELDRLEKVFIRRNHIEKDRIYRGITLDDVRRVLKNGGVFMLRDSDSSLLWRGKDEGGRCIELNCGLKTEEGDLTLLVQEAQWVVVGTAYEPGVDDDDLKQRWLSIHPDYEDAGKRKGVQKKLLVSGGSV